MRTALPGVAAAVLLFILTALWVAPTIALVTVHYYIPNYSFGMFPRAFTGAIAHALALSPDGFVILLQLFKFGWLVLLCTQIFRWIHDRYVAFFICFLFAFSSSVYINDHMSGLVDLAVNFWQMLAAMMIVRYPERSHRATVFWLCVALLPLYVSVLTHDIAILSGSVLVVWAWLYYGRTALGMLAGWVGGITVYLWMTWKIRAFGADSPAIYLDSLLHAENQRFFHEFFSIPGIMLAGGMLWVLGAWLGWKAIRYQSDVQAGYSYPVFLVFALLVNLAPLLIASDTNRMVSGIWLVVYLLLIDRSDYLNARINTIKTDGIWALICLIQLLIPPLFISAQRAVPLNSYAEKWLPVITVPKRATIWALMPMPKYDRYLLDSIRKTNKLIGRVGQ